MTETPSGNQSGNPSRKRTIGIAAAVGVAGIVAGGLGATALSAAADDGGDVGFGNHGRPGYFAPPNGGPGGPGQPNNGQGGPGQGTPGDTGQDSGDGPT